MLFVQFQRSLYPFAVYDSFCFLIQQSIFKSNKKNLQSQAPQVDYILRSLQPIIAIKFATFSFQELS